MKHLKLLSSTVLFLGIGFLLHAQSNMNVVLNSGTNPAGLPLTNIAKLTFSGGNMNVVTKVPAGITPYTITNIKRVDFKAGIVEPPVTTCLNANGDFADGTTNWAIWPGTTTSSAASGALVISSASTGAWAIQASTFYTFESGKDYTITFKAKSSAPKDIVVMVRDNYVPVTGLEYTKSITTTMDTHTITFKFPAQTVTKGELLLACGGGNDFTIDDLCISESGTLSNETVELTNNFLMYPNPVKTTFNMNVPAAGNVDIISLDGKVLMSHKVNASETNTINIENLSAGIYLCRYSNSKEVKTLKLIKQ